MGITQTAMMAMVLCLLGQPAIVPIDFAAMPLFGSVDVPLNAHILVPVPSSLVRIGDDGEYRYSLIRDDGLDVDVTLEVLRVTHQCDDVEVMRVRPKRAPTHLSSGGHAHRHHHSSV